MVDPNQSIDLLALCKRAGLEDHEMRTDPKQGLLISATGLQKLRRFAPESYNKAQLGQQAANAIRRTFREVE